MAASHRIACSDPDAPSVRVASPTRRDFLWQAGGGFGSLALAALLHADSTRAAEAAEAKRPDPLAPRASHFPPRAKRVVYLFMHGGPSHLDLFDPKPDLFKYAGQPLPESFGPVMTRRKVAANPLLPPLKAFRPHGESGVEINDLLPHLAGRVDDMCLLRSCHGDSVNHPQSVYQMNTGSVLMGKPSVGSWIAYGLGSANRNMPAFVVMTDPTGGIKGGPPSWGSGFLPATFQGTTMRPGKSPILHLQPPDSISDAQQRRSLDLIRALNARHLEQRGSDDELAARVESYELAFRMQAAAPEVVDLSGETRETLAMYGVGEKETDEFGTRCLLARRMLERDVRFVQLYIGDSLGWDAHTDIAKNHAPLCRRFDQPAAALLADLKQRGLLEDTLVICGGEFGRMPMSEQGTGRDHNPWGYTVCLAGAGVKPGHIHGATDAIGLRAETDKVHIHDLHATILYLLGLDHELLTYSHNGREERLTDVAGRVVREILA